MGLRRFRRNLRKAERSFFDTLLGILLVVGLLGPIVAIAINNLSKWVSKHNGEIMWSTAAIVFLGLVIRALFRSNFKPEKYVDSRGYVVLNNSNELEHRHIAKQILGRDLCPNEIVHHINGKKTENDIWNLCLMANEKHEHFSLVVEVEKRKDRKIPVN